MFRMLMHAGSGNKHENDRAKYAIRTLALAGSSYGGLTITTLHGEHGASPLAKPKLAPTPTCVRIHLAWRVVAGMACLTDTNERANV